MICLGAPSADSALATTKAFNPVSGSRYLRYLTPVELFDVHAAVMGERHGRRAVMRRVRDRKVDLLLGWHAGFEGHAVGLGHRVADPVFDKVQAFLFLQSGLQFSRLTDQAGRAFLADAALEHRLDED